MMSHKQLPVLACIGYPAACHVVFAVVSTDDDRGQISSGAAINTFNSQFPCQKIMEVECPGQLAAVNGHYRPRIYGMEQAHALD